MLGEIICDLRLDGSEHLFDQELSGKEAAIPRK